MALSIGTLVGYLDLDDSKFDGKLGKAQGKFGKFGGAMAGAVATGAAAAAAAVAGFAAYGVKEFVSFETGMNEIFTLLPGISQSSMDQMKKDVRAWNVELGIPLNETLPAMADALGSGIPEENIYDFMTVAAKGAVGGNAELGTSVDALTSVVNAYGQENLDAQRASDIMFQSILDGKSTMDDMAGSLYQVTPTAAALGVKFEDIGAALAVMTAAGVPTRVATTQLRSAFTELSKSGTKASDIFQEMSGKTFKEFIAEGGNTQDALKLMEEYANDAGVGINDLFGSVEAGNAALSLTGGNTKAFTEALKSMEGSAGATEGAFNTMDQGIGRSMERIKISFTEAALNVGDSLAPAIQQVADFAVANMPLFQAAVETALSTVGTWVKNLTLWWQENRDTVLPVLSAIGIAAQFLGGILLGALKGAIDGVMQVLQGLVQVGRGVIDFFRAVFAGEWGAAWEAVKQIAIGLFNVIVGAIKTWLNVSIMGIFRGGVLRLLSLWKGGLTALKTAAAAIWKAITSAFSAAVKGIAKLISGAVKGYINLWLSFFKTVGSIVANGWAVLRSAFGGALAAIRTVVSSALNAVVGFFRTGMSRARSAVSTGVNTLRNLFSTGMSRIRTAVSTGINKVMGFIRGIPGKIKGALGNMGTLLYSAGQDVIQGFINGIKNMAGAVGSAVGGIASGAASKVRGILGISSPSRVFMEIGHWTGKGLEQGLLKEKSNVAKAAEALANVPDTVPMDTFTVGDSSLWGRVLARAPQAPAAEQVSGWDREDLDYLIAGLGAELRGGLDEQARVLTRHGRSSD